LKQLSEKNLFSRLNYDPNLIVLQKELKSLRLGEVYITHAARFLSTYPKYAGLDSGKLSSISYEKLNEREAKEVKRSLAAQKKRRRSRQGHETEAKRRKAE